MLCPAFVSRPRVIPNGSGDSIADRPEPHVNQRASGSWSCFVVGLAIAAQAFAADLRLEAHALADGRTAVLLDSRLYLPDTRGRLARAADGEYHRRQGGALVVVAGRATAPADRRFDLPAPRLALASSLTSGEAVALVEGELLFVEANGERRPVPDGTYHFRNGAAAQVRGGRITSLGDLAGFRQIDPGAPHAPGPDGTTKPPRGSEGR